MVRFLKIAALAMILFYKIQAMAQEEWPICAIPSQKVVAWNRCIGSYAYPNGVKYFGGWRNDFASGEGILIYPNKSMYIGAFSNDKAVGRGAIVNINGRVIKAGYANSPGIGEQLFLNVGDAYIEESDGYFGYEQVGQYIRTIQDRFGRYLDFTKNQTINSQGSTAPNSPAQKYSQPNSSASGVDSKVTHQRQKCLRLGLSPGSDDFKLCLQQ